MEVRVVEASDADLDAYWQKATIVRSPQQMPCSPRRDSPAATQEQSITRKRRKGGRFAATLLAQQALHGSLPRCIHLQ